MSENLVKLMVTVAVVLLVSTAVGGQAYASGYGDDGQNGLPEYVYYIEGTGSYYLPGTGVDIFFNLGKWYRRSGDSWSMSDDPGGPWSGITVGTVPKDLAELPADFRETRHLGMIPYRYVAGPDKRDDDYLYRYYRGRYYDDYEGRGYRRRWNPHGGFWFYVAPDFDDDHWGDSHRRRRRGRY